MMFLILTYHAQDKGVAVHKTMKILIPRRLYSLPGFLWCYGDISGLILYTCNYSVLILLLIHTISQTLSIPNSHLKLSATIAHVKVQKLSELFQN